MVYLQHRIIFTASIGIGNTDDVLAARQGKRLYVEITDKMTDKDNATDLSMTGYLLREPDHTFKVCRRPIFRPNMDHVGVIGSWTYGNPIISFTIGFGTLAASAILVIKDKV
eukprot:scaffold22562_cov153-Cylindrotheca_fusiformis.AAC.5